MVLLPLLLLTVPAQAAELGNDVIARPLHDGASGSIFFLN